MGTPLAQEPTASSTADLTAAVRNCETNHVDRYSGTYQLLLVCPETPMPLARTAASRSHRIPHGYLSPSTMLLCTGPIVSSSAAHHRRRTWPRLPLLRLPAAPAPASGQAPIPYSAEWAHACLDWTARPHAISRIHTATASRPVVHPSSHLGPVALDPPNGRLR
jgi:hypothetical protein